MKLQKIFINNRFGESLETAIKYDGKKEKYPTVLFVSGFDEDFHEYANTFDEIAEKLVKKAFLTIQFSFAGLGKSEGDYKKTTLERQTNQIKDIFESIRKNPKVNPRRIGIIAQSFGVPSLILALPLPSKSLVFISGVVNPYEEMKEIFVKRNSFNPTGTSTLPRSDGKFTAVGPGFWKSLKNINLHSCLKTHQKPLLILHGSADTHVPVDEVKGFYQKFSGKKSLKIYEGGDHGITDVPKAMHQEFLDDIVSWLKKTL